MKLSEIVPPDYFKTSLYEMSNFSTKATGLMPGTILWVRVEPNALQHTKYRVKFKHPPHGSAVFAIWGDPVQIKSKDSKWEPTGNDLKQILTLLSNKIANQSIKDHIDGKITSDELIEKLKEARGQKALKPGDQGKGLYIRQLYGREYKLNIENSVHLVLAHLIVKSISAENKKSLYSKINALIKKYGLGLKPVESEKGSVLAAGLSIIKDYSGKLINNEQDLGKAIKDLEK